MQTFTYYPFLCKPPTQAAVYFDRVFLKPGENQLSDEDATTLENHPDYARYQEWGAVVKVSQVNPTPTPSENQAEGNEGEDTKPIETLKDMRAAEAIALIQSTDDRALLEQWKAGEDRVTVGREIDERLEALASDNG